MKKNIAIVLAFLALAFIGCDKNTPYQPGPQATTDEFVYFPSPYAMGLELDPDAKIDHQDIVIARTKADTVLEVRLIVTKNTDGVFTLPDSVRFETGELQKVITAQFDTTMQVGSTYAFEVSVDMANVNPYALLADADEKPLSPTYNYEATLIKYVPGIGVFVDDAVIASTFGVDPTLAWYVNYQIAELPSGKRKLRIINPFASMATDQDEDGILDGYPYNDPGDWDDTKDYNIMLIIDPEDNSVVLESKQVLLGVSWSTYGMMFLYDYDGAVGRYSEDSAFVTFDQADATLVFGMGSSLYNYAGFTFYLSKEAYLDATAAPAIDADVTTYEGAWKVEALDLDTDDPVSANITITSVEGEQGQYYTIAGLHADLPVVTGGVFDAKTHHFKIGLCAAAEMEKDGKTVIPYLVPIDDDGTVLYTAVMKFAPAEDGSIVLTDDSEATGFMIIYVNKDDQTDQEEGAGMYQLKLTKAAAGAPAKAAKHTRNLKQVLPFVKAIGQIF